MLQKQPSLRWNADVERDGVIPIKHTLTCRQDKLGIELTTL